MRKAIVSMAVWTTMLASLCSIGNAQVYKFQKYGVVDKGFCHSAVYAITQDKHGFIWFATGTGLCRYDGFRFSSPDNENLPSSNVSAAFGDKNGNLWFGYNNGLVIRYDGYDFTVADTSRSATNINQIIEAPGGEILVATQKQGITRIKENKIEYLSLESDDKLIHSICFAGNNKLLVGCDDGLYLYNYKEDEPLSLAAKADTLSYISIPAIISLSEGGYRVATEEDGIYDVVVNGDELSVKALHIPDLEDARVQSICEDFQKNLWISTYGKGLFRIRLSPDKTVEKINNYNAGNGLGTNDIKQVFFDNRRNLWVATYGQGAASITNLAFSFFENIEPVGNNATAISSVNDSEYWIAGQGAIVKITSDAEQKTTVLRHANGVPADRITALHRDGKGDLWIGTEKSGLYKLAKDAKSVSSFQRWENSLSNAIQAITSSGDKLWVASRDGVLHIDTQTGSYEKFGTTSEIRLPHNYIRDIYKDSKGLVWIATNSSSILTVNGEERLTPEDEGEIEFSSIVEDNKGRLWAGTLGRGIYLFDRGKDTVTVHHFMPQDGLKSEFCYALAYDGNGHVWAGHRLGLSCINVDRLTVTGYGTENGITGDVNPNAMTVNGSKEMLVGMTDGVMLYDIGADYAQGKAPMLNLTGVTIGDSIYHPGKTITLPYGHYKVQFDFIGLQYSNPESVTYQYMLQGSYENEWSTPTNKGTAVYHVGDGEYKLWIKACNSDDCTEKSIFFTLKVRKPFWKTWWFIFLMIIIFIGAVYVIIMVRERNHRIQQEYLERELAARTKEVREQKEEIEAKNRDITDSINYAQRIQFSVLPSTSTLLDHCAGAFIFYRPRDIVSGDFYWFDYFPENNRLLIVCADSTGHGVPGAFMSLIGTTLIKDIAGRADIQNPADILYRLDENIQSTLNQNQESEQANDGMDIVVCEINTETHYVKVASAMRPFIVYHKGVPTTYKCNRSSIGGQRIENKVFDTTELQLSPGDTIYMFTDGYTDQFGGPSGKKFKMNRLQSILDDVNKRDIEEQHRVIKENFDLWKGALSQVDDVLLIGVRV